MLHPFDDSLIKQVTGYQNNCGLNLLAHQFASDVLTNRLNLEGQRFQANEIMNHALDQGCVNQQQFLPLLNSLERCLAESREDVLNEIATDLNRPKAKL